MRSTALRPTTSRQALAPNNRGSSWRSATGAGRSAPVPKHIVARSSASGRISRGHGARVPAAGFRRVWAVEHAGRRPRGLAPRRKRRVPHLGAGPAAPSRPQSRRRSTRLCQGRSFDRHVAFDPPSAHAARVDPEPLIACEWYRKGAASTSCGRLQKPCDILRTIADGAEATKGAARCGLRDGFIG
jgi:hypothetical protein